MCKFVFATLLVAILPVSALQCNNIQIIYMEKTYAFTYIVRKRLMYVQDYHTILHDTAH